MSESRVLVLTPPGAAAIAVVRLAGPRLQAFLDAHFSRPAVPGRCVHGELRDSAGDLIDDPVIVLSPDRSSADVNLHGGPWIVRRVVDLARAAGFTPVHPSLPLPDDWIDFADPLEREMLASVPMARTEAALRILLAQPRAWKSAPHLAEPLAADMTEAQRACLRAMLNDASLWWLLNPPRVAIVGPPNVGKSTLANQLFAQERSITADLPGTTRDWVGEMANIDGLAVMLVDTPGLRASADPIERRAIEQSAGVIGGADLVIVVLDASAPPDRQDRSLAERFTDPIVVLNKVDQRNPAGGSFPGAIQTVATSGQGMDLLRQAICLRFGCEDLADLRPRWWTPRQRQHLEQVLAVTGPASPRRR